MTRYAYSEHVTAGPTSREHISPADDGLKLGGGAPPALCGRDWSNGWHLDRYVTAENLAASESFVCCACADEWTRRTKDISK